MLHQIGVGALGPVFRTYEPTRDRLVAVKVFRLDITPEQARALADELSKAAEAGLFHPSIVEPIAAGVEGTVAYRAEEYVAAETLDVAMRHYAPAALDKALPFITQLAGAIDFARAGGVGHGALHPRDIFVTPDEARATGFGVVDALERVGLRAPVRRPYSAPERVEGGRWGTAADVFSLAAIAYELLTGRRPSGTGAGLGTLAGARVGDQADAFLSVLTRAMDPDPSRRYPGALAFAAALEEAGSARGEPGRAARAVAVPAVATSPEGEDDVAAERDEDEAHHELTLREREQTEAGESTALFDGDEDEEPEAAADRALIAAAAVAGGQADEKYRDEFLASGVDAVDRARKNDVDGVEDAAAEELPDVAVGHARARTVPWDPDHARIPLDPDPDYRTAGAVVPAQRSRVLPLAAILSIGLLVGFAVGYGVGSRDPDRAPAGPASVDATNPAGPQAPAPAGKDWSEQAVAQPQPGGRAQPPAIPPPIPSEEPPEAAGALRSAATAGRLVVRSTPSRAAVTINGTWRGRTPLTVERLPFGKYSVRVIQPGYAVAREELALSLADPSRTLSVRLQADTSRRPPAREVPRAASTPPQTQTPAAAPARGRNLTGSIYVDSRPRGARVLLDGRMLGTTPVSIPEVPIGSHVVRLELPDHRPWTASRQVTAGQQERITGSLDRIR